MEEKYLFIHQSPPPFWKVFIAAVIFTISFYCLFRFIRDIIVGLPSLLDFYFFAILFLIGFPISVTQNFHFDMEKDRFKDEYQWGLIKIGWWEPMISWEYVSVFQISDGVFVIRLWMEGNDFFTVAGYNEIEIALKQGIHIGKTMNIDVLDAATNPRDSQWIELD